MMQAATHAAEEIRILIGKRMAGLFRVVSLSLLSYTLATNPVIATEETSELLRQQLEQAASLENDRPAAVRVDLLYEFYVARDLEPAWTEKNRQALQGLLRDAESHGLRPEDYSLEEIAALDALDRLSPPDRVSADVLLTRTLLMLGYHLRVGKAQPSQLDANWNVARSMREDIIARIESVVTGADLRAAFRQQFPEMPVYEALQVVLERHRRIAADGGFRPVAAGPTLRLGDRDDRVTALRARLVQQGFLSEISDDDRFDEELLEAVELFQLRHGLNGDGVVGKGTLRELNVPVETRIGQIRASLERLRWVQDEDFSRALMVNIAGFMLNLVLDDDVVFAARTQVGKPFRQTPIFRASLKYLVLNPTWTVPPGILKKDVLPAIKKDVGYLSRKNMDVLTTSGDLVDPAGVDWQRYPRAGFPYVIRQRPGPWNALGTIKFIFPNEHYVFVHDTPSRELFRREDRTFSSGCIRTENPLGLAEQVLQDPATWNHDSLEDVLDSGQTRTIFLEKELPVYLLYLTAVAFDDGGTFYFFRDVYDRDPALLAALDNPSN